MRLRQSEDFHITFHALVQPISEGLSYGCVLNINSEERWKPGKRIGGSLRRTAVCVAANAEYKEQRRKRSGQQCQTTKSIERADNVWRQVKGGDRDVEPAATSTTRFSILFRIFLGFSSSLARFLTQR